MQPIQIFNRLLQPCGNCKAVAAGVLSIEQIEYDLSASWSAHISLSAVQSLYLSF